MNPDTQLRPILLIDDNPMDIDLTRRVFQRSRVYNPFQEARNAEEALSIIDCWNEGAVLPVYILLDLRLPGLDGFELLTRLKSHPRYRNIPVIVLTTSIDENDMLEARRLGADSYVVKPVAFEEFIQVAAQINQYWNIVDLDRRESE